MTINRNTIQLTLVLIGLALIFLTYFLYPTIKKSKFEEEILQEKEKLTTEKESNRFENVEYNGLYDLENKFKVYSETAYILNENPDLVYMDTMKVVLHMKDGRAIVITSDKGRYDKTSYDCFFETNVKATDGKTIIFAENMDLLASKDSADVYNNVVLNNESGSLRADKVSYNFETKYYKISMFNNEKVKVKLIN